MDPIQLLCMLRKSGTEAVVGENGLTEFQRGLYVATGLDSYLRELVLRSTRDSEADGAVDLLVLSGNAGDGKSNLIANILDGMGLPDGNVVQDATHADAPDEHQTGTLFDFFSPFEDSASARPDGLRVIAINTGMVVSLFRRFEELGLADHFKLLEHTLFDRLGIKRGAPPRVPWHIAVVNLDNRRLVRSGNGSFLEALLEKLDPLKPGSILHEVVATHCSACTARDWCFPVANVQALQDGTVRASIEGLLEQAELEASIHLTPRNVLDWLYWVITGGLDWFSASASACHRIRELAAERDVGTLQTKLFYNTVFDRRDGDPVSEAVAALDPANRGGLSVHRLLCETLHRPAAAFSSANTLGSRFSSALTVLTEPGMIADHLLGGLARGAPRLAYLIGEPAEAAAELHHDPELSRFRRVLAEYAAYSLPAGGREAHADYPLLEELRSELASAITRTFGLSHGGRVFFVLASLRPVLRFPILAPVDLQGALGVEPDHQIEGDHEISRALGYSPTCVVARIGTSDRSVDLQVTLPLFRLTSRVNEGYNASSEDLQRFFALRYACARVGGMAAAAGTNEVLVRDLAGGRLFRVRKLSDLSGQPRLDIQEA